MRFNSLVCQKRVLIIVIDNIIDSFKNEIDQKGGVAVGPADGNTTRQLCQPATLPFWSISFLNELMMLSITIIITRFLQTMNKR